MPNEAINKEQKLRVIIYHGHLHKIPKDDEIKEIKEKELITAKNSLIEG
jgi:predicted phosphodiesterase